MSFLIDTNIISEVCKRGRCDPKVAAWWRRLAEVDLWLCSLVLGEIRKGVQLARRHDSRKTKALEGWLADIVSGFGDRVLPVDAAVVDQWGRMSAIRSVPVIDALMAATAKVYGLTLVTRNVVDVAGLEVDDLNPFEI